jgi:branched-chain amino acid transport system substrate-binding protein
MRPDRLIPLVLAGAVAFLAGGATAAESATPGVTAGEIKIGETMPYSGPTSAWASEGFADVALVKTINDQGGINGRKLNLISLDDGYSPPKAVEQTRKLVEEDGVAFIYHTLGTATNSAIAKYLGDRKIPQLFIATGASKFTDPDKLPWAMGWLNYPTEAAIYANYIRAAKPDAKIAILYQNDDLGRDYLNGFKRALGAGAARMIVREESFEVTDATVDSQIISLQASGADVLLDFASVKATTQALRKSYDLGWKPMQFLITISNSVGTVLRPAGLEKAAGAITATFAKDPSDAKWQDDPGVKAWNAWMDKYLPKADRTDMNYVYTTITMELLRQTLVQCGDDLSRANIMRQATNLKGVTAGMLLPGITMATTPTDYRPIKQMQLERFDGSKWVLFGDIISDR